MFYLISAIHVHTEGDKINCLFYISILRGFNELLNLNVRQVSFNTRLSTN